MYSGDRSSSGKYAVEFVAPHPLDKCVAYLDNKNEKARLLAFDWQTRTKVRFKRLPDDRIQFTVKKAPKSRFDWDWGVAAIKGYLTAVSERQTLVQVQSPSLLGTALFYGGSLLVFCLFLGFSVLSSSTEVQPEALALPLGFALVVLVITFVWREAQISGMIRMVKNTLESPDVVSAKSTEGRRR